MSSLTEAIDAGLSSLNKELRVALPARVESYDADKQKASLQPLLLDFYEDERGARKTERLPVVSDVPVLFPSGGGAFVTFPVATGDTGLLLCADRSLDVWLNRGGEVDPNDTRCHHLTDAVFLPGLYPFSAPRSGVSATHVVVHLPPGKELHLGEEAPADFVAMAQKVLDALDALKGAISAAAVTPAADGGASFKAGLLAQLSAWPPGVGSTTVRVRG